MKNSLRFFSIFALYFSCHFGAVGQFKGQIRGINAYEYDFGSRLTGFNFAGEYFPAHYLSLSPSYTIFFPRNGKNLEFGFQGRYYITEKKRQWYGTVGYGSATRIEELDGFYKSVKHFANVGFGGMLKLNESLGINPELRKQLGQQNNLVLRVGMVYFIN